MLSCCFVSCDGDCYCHYKDFLTIFIPGCKEGDVELLFCLDYGGCRCQDTRWYARLSRHLVIIRLWSYTNVFKYYQMYSGKTKDLNFRGSAAWDVRRTMSMSRCYGGVDRGEWGVGGGGDGGWGGGVGGIGGVGGLSMVGLILPMVGLILSMVGLRRAMLPMGLRRAIEHCAVLDTSGTLVLTRCWHWRRWRRCQDYQVPKISSHQVQKPWIFKTHHPTNHQCTAVTIKKNQIDLCFTWEGQGCAECPPPWQAKVQRWWRCWWRWSWWSWWCWWWCILAEHGGVTLHSSSPWWWWCCLSLVGCSGAQSGAGVTLHSLHKLVQASVFQLLKKRKHYIWFMILF